MENVKSEKEKYLTVEDVEINPSKIKRRLRELFLELKDCLRTKGYPSPPFNRFLREYYIDEGNVERIVYIAGELRRLVKICQIYLLKRDSTFFSAPAMAGPLSIFASLEELLQHVNDDGTIYGPGDVKSLLIKIQGAIEETIGLLDYTIMEGGIREQESS